MKRYALFVFNAYYPYGGWGDCFSTYDTIEEAKEMRNGDLHHFYYHQIVDLQNGNVIEGDCDRSHLRNTNDD